MVHRRAKEFGSPGELKDYLREHPQADPHKHTVRSPGGGSGSGAARTKTKIDKGLAEEIGKVWRDKPSSNAVDSVRRMIESGKEISVNMLDRAVTTLNNEAKGATGDQQKALRALRDKLKGHIHSKEAAIARNVALRTRLAQRA